MGTRRKTQARGSRAQKRREPTKKPRSKKPARPSKISLKLQKRGLKKESAPALQPKAHESSGEANMCLGCDGHCCSLRVELTPFDIARIAHQEGKKAEEFTALAAAKPDDAFSFRINGGRFKFILAKKDGKCCFFRKGALNCSIEGSKPALCLIYPFSSSYGVTYVRREAVCPTDNLRRADDKKMSSSVLRDYYWESARYEYSLKIWNRYARGNETLEQFYKFIAADIDADKSRFASFRRGLGRLMLRVGLR